MHNWPQAFLRMVRARLEQGWIQGPFARDRDGMACHPTAETAVCWCLQGAVMRVIDEWKQAFLYEGEVWLLEGDAGREAAQTGLNALIRVTQSYPTPLGSLPLFNEDPRRTKEEVLALVDRAIAACATPSPLLVRDPPRWQPVDGRARLAGV